MPTNRTQGNARLFTLTMILALLALWIVAAQASANVYWTNPEDSSIGRADNSGGEVDQTFVGGLVIPLGIAVDTSHIYWTDPEIQAIGRSNLDGSAVEKNFITGIEGADGIAVDAGHIYWTSEGETESIGRASLDGQNVEENFIPNTGEPRAIAVDAGHIYWTEEEGIGRADLAGGSIEQPFIPLPSVSHGVAVDAGHVYWTLEVGNAIGRATLAGGEINNAFISGPVRPSGIAVDAGHIYWGAGFGGDKAIARSNLDGSGVQPAFVQTNSEVFGVALDPAPPPPPTPIPDPTPTPIPVPTPTPTPSPSPTAAPAATCGAVSAAATTFAPATKKPGGVVLGVRARVTVGTPSQLSVAPTLIYKNSNGKARSVALESVSYNSEGVRNLRLPLPGNLGSKVPLGTLVTLSLKISATPNSSPACTSPSTSTKRLKAKVVQVLAAAQIDVS